MSQRIASEDFPVWLEDIKRVPCLLGTSAAAASSHRSPSPRENVMARGLAVPECLAISKKSDSAVHCLDPDPVQPHRALECLAVVFRARVDD